MSWELIKSVQKQTDMRLVLPFALNLKLGDVVSVGRDGGFTLEGSSQSVLGIAIDQIRPPQPAGADLMEQFGKNTSCRFRAQGTASTLFQNLPSANAGFDITFGTANSWLLATVKRQVTALEDVNIFREAILAAYRRGVWKADWALITSIGTADRFTLIASSSSDTNLAVTIAGQVDASAAANVKFTSGITIAASNHQVIQSIVTEPSIVFCKGVRVKDSWFSDITTGDLSFKVREHAAEDFWEDADSSARNVEF